MKIDIYRSIPSVLLALSLAAWPATAQMTPADTMDGMDGMMDTAGYPEEPDGMMDPADTMDGMDGMMDTADTMNGTDGMMDTADTMDGYNGMEDTAGYTEEKNGGMAWEKLELTGTITSVDQQQQTVTIQGPRGDEMTLAVGEDVDLATLSEGDRVKAEYLQALAVEVREPTQEEMDQPLAVLDRRMRTGNGNGAANVREIRAVVEVIEINRQEQTARIRGPRGNEFPVFIEDPARLDRLTEGQMAVVTYTEATALSLEKQ